MWCCTTRCSVNAIAPTRPRQNPDQVNVVVGAKYDTPADVVRAFACENNLCVASANIINNSDNMQYQVELKPLSDSGDGAETGNMGTQQFFNTNTIENGFTLTPKGQQFSDQMQLVIKHPGGKTTVNIQRYRASKKISQLFEITFIDTVALAEEGSGGDPAYDGLRSSASVTALVSLCSLVTAAAAVLGSSGLRRG